MKKNKILLILIIMAVTLAAISLRLFLRTSAQERIAFIYMDERSVGLYTIATDGTDRDQVLSSNFAPGWVEDVLIKFPSLQTSTKRQILYPDLLRAPSWLGSSGTLGFLTRKVGQYCEWVSLVEAKSSEENNLVCLDTYAQIQVLDWAPDGSKFAIASRSRSTTSIRVATATGEFISHRTLPHYARGVAWSPDSTLLAVSTDGPSGIVIYNEEGLVKELHPEAEVLSQPTWSPDGQSIAFFCMNEQQIDLCLMNTDGDEFRQFSFETSFPYIKNGLTWSPAGDYLAFSGIQHQGSTDIFLISPDGTELRQLTHHNAADSFPSWSPDGSSLVFTSMRDGNWEIYTIQVDGNGLKRITDTPGDEIDVVWSSPF